VYFFFALPTAIVVSALTTAILLFRARRRALGVGFLGFAGLFMTLMAAPCARQQLSGHHDDWNFCSPPAILMFNAYWVHTVLHQHGL
jgi:hypothetical protein